MTSRRKQARAGAIRRVLAAVAFAGVLGSSQMVLAQEDAAPAPAAAVATDAAPAPMPDAGEAKADAPEEGSNEDLAAKLKEVSGAYSELKEAKESGDSPMKFAWALMIAAIANFLVSVVKRAMKLTGKAKRILPWVAVGLGAVGGVAAHFGAGMSLFDSMLYGGAAMGSIVLQELGIGVKSKA